MTGHSGAVMELHFSPDGSNLYTASTDMTLGLWDIVVGTRIKKLKGHTSFVNSIAGARRGPTQLCSGSDDSTIRVWDPRKRGQCYTLNNTYQVLFIKTYSILYKRDYISFVNTTCLISSAGNFSNI